MLEECLVLTFIYNHFLVSNRLNGLRENTMTEEYKSFKWLNDRSWYGKERKQTIKKSRKDK